MAGLTSGVAFLLLLWTAGVGGTEVKAKISEDVILPCWSERAITLLEWKMQGKDSEGFVFFFRENRSYESYQIPSFKHRVQLSDPKMKDGNMSVTLKNVTSSDSGEYECSFHISRKHRSRRATDFSYTVKLRVVDGNSAGDSAGNSAGDLEQHGGRQPLAMAVPLLALFAVVAVLIAFWKLKAHTEQPAADEAGEQQEV
ncbi:butyrophilin-like protein 9 isoform X3 [Acanthochromis polyacanthus]|uniref:butyrophilin-like protein 9 isoform X3 n=1 Tax=Acanthochromis polyacanthus TaxID=80966 RepID=UPI0022349434|nr:butyrophilin-like protein 9 isoform X3 [Acanthochromis polyacanthus]